MPRTGMLYVWDEADGVPTLDQVHLYKQIPITGDKLDLILNGLEPRA